jgi:hypothetical protein
VYCLGYVHIPDVFFTPHSVQRYLFKNMYKAWQLIIRITFHFLSFHAQWTLNNPELQLRHSKRGREDGKGKGEQDGKESV